MSKRNHHPMEFSKKILVVAAIVNVAVIIFTFIMI